MNSGASPVIRALRLLGHLAEHGEPTTIRELSAALELAPSTVHRLLQLLRADGYIVREPDDARYRIGGAFFRIASAVVDQLHVSDVATSVLDELVEQIEEPCLLALRVTGTLDYVFVDRRSAGVRLGFEMPLHEPSPIAWGASGQAILAHLPPADQVTAIAQAPPCPASGEPADPMLLEAICDRTRSKGYSVGHGRRIPGMVGIAAPFRSPAGHVLGSLCIAIPETRFFPLQEHLTGNLVIRAATQLSEFLGADRIAASKDEMEEVV